ncbi:MAG TPA: NADH-quinone oxidoreductase subunit C [Phenylobacterium sp.]|uniref:hydrogenase large subunit n=1 Tax=Phenylobacterium sp. TaxID=1871053 RepID=UPI002F91DBFB
MTEARIVDGPGWRRIAAALQRGELELVSLWGEPGQVHVAVREAGPELAVHTLPCPDGSYPSLAAVHPPAARLERALADLVGLRPDGAADARPWLDHGRWGIAHPMGCGEPVSGEPAGYPFLLVEGEGLHEVPVGPVHAGIIEPGHFRFTANGEAVVRLEQRFGYAHKGVLALMAGAPIERAAQLAGRMSGDSTVAYAFAFALAVEEAWGVAAPPRAQWLRGLMAELERVANHLGDIGAICNDAAFAIMLAHCRVLRERVLRASAIAFGHRLMMDAIAPGGLAVDLSLDGVRAIEAALGQIEAVFPHLADVYDETNSLQDRTVGTGVVKAEYAQAFAAGGFVGRASGRDFDARKRRPYEPYDALAFDVPALTEGDVNARVWVRIREVLQSLILARECCGACRRDRSGPSRPRRRPRRSRVWRWWKASAATSSPGCGWMRRA